MALQALQADLTQVLVGTRIIIESIAPGISGEAEIICVRFFGELESSARYINMWSVICRNAKYEFGQALGKTISLALLTPIFEKHGLTLDTES